jgi:hypothetical protein
MSTDDQRLSSAITAEALLAAQRAELQPIIDQLAEACQGRDDLRIEAAGELAGAWLANPEAAPRWGFELIAAGMLLVGGIHDSDMLKQAVLTGWERRLGSIRGYGPDDRW